MENEIYKTIIIDNIETFYNISNFGNVKNIKTNKIIKPEASKILNFDTSHLCACCNNKIKTAYGFIFKYKMQIS